LRGLCSFGYLIPMPFPKPRAALTPNTYEYESSPLVKPTGFREYDARWLLEKEINLMGVQALGMGLGTLIREMGVEPLSQFPRQQNVERGGEIVGVDLSERGALGEEGREPGVRCRR
jgi:hypothetical protein